MVPATVWSLVLRVTVTVSFQHSGPEATFTARGLPSCTGDASRFIM